MSTPSGTAFSKPPSAPSALPDWAPWVAMLGLLVVGVAGAFGLIPSPFKTGTFAKPEATAAAVAAARTAPTAAPSEAPMQAGPPPGTDNGPRPPGVPEVVEVRQILVQHKTSWKKAEQVTRTKEEAKKRCEEALAKLEQGVPWDKVMEEYSDNPSTKKNGGSIGPIRWEQANWLVKEPIFKLKLGERSPVTESPFGYHVYQRIK